MSSDDTHISVSDDVGGVNMPASRSEMPMTPDQASRLKILAAERGMPPDLDLTSEQAAKRIQELEGKTARGGAKDA